MSIAQTPDGYLWLATQAGLVRFDGLQFATFNTDNSPGMISERIWTLKTDDKGAVWMGMGKGMSRFMSGKFTNFTRENGMLNDEVTSLCIDGNGAVWGAGNAGLDRIYEGKVTSIQTKELPDGIREITVDRKGVVWVLAQDKGLYVIENDRLVAKTIPGIEAPKLRGFYQDTRGDYWAGIVFLGLARWDDKESTVFPRGLDIPDADLVTEGIVQDKSGGFWFSFPPIGLGYRHNGRFEMIRPEDGLPTKQIRSLFVDREDNLWMGSANSGLIRLRRKWVQNLNELNGLPNYLARAIWEESPGRFLVANEHGGLYRLENEKFTFVSGGAFGSLWTLARGQKGDIFGGKYPFGVARLPDTLQTEPELEMKSEGHVQAILQDSTGGLWIASETGVHYYSGGRVIPVSRNAGVEGQFSALAEDDEGRIWAGGHTGGLVVIHGTNVIAYGTAEGLRSDSVQCVHKDMEGRIWVGTNRGLSLFVQGGFWTLGKGEGLEEESINQILDDGLGNLWLGTNAGIFRLRKRDIHSCFAGATKTVHPLKIGKQEGLISLECRKDSQPNCLRASDGKLYFLTLKSIVVIDPGRIPANRVPPPVVIQQVLVDGNALRNEPDESGIKVEAGALRVEYHFAGLSLSAPESIRYRYRLADYDQDWVEGGLRRFASYTRVPPGKYTFHVQAANNDGLWNEPGASLAVTILPRFWEAFWFQFGGTLIFLLALVGLYKRRVAQIELQRLEQEAFARQLLDSQERERRRIAGELHDSLSQELQLIRNRAQMALNFANPPPDVAEQLSEISKASGKAIAETRAISYALRPPELEHFGITKAIESLVEKVGEASGLEMHQEIEPIDRLLKGEMEINLYRIVQEGLNNVVKHAKAKKVIVGMTRRGAHIEVSIYDDGRGIGNGSEEREGKKRGGGRGLSGMKERARILGGTLEIQSALGKGTRLTIVFPVSTQNAS